MGQGWRRVSEAVRQKVGMNGADKAFKATENSRNEAMFREATTFAHHLRVMERDLRSMSKQVDGQFNSLKDILLSPLPRAWDMGANGPVPLELQPQAIGQNVNIDKILQSADEMKKRLEAEVIQPVKEWMVAYRTIQDRMKQLESVRLELDSRRRTVTDVECQLERMRANVHTLGSKGMAEMEKLTNTELNKREKMMRTHAQFQDVERTVYNSLFTLVRDTSVLREYTAAALQIIQECFVSAHSAYDTPPALEYSTATAANGYGPSAIVDVDANRYDAQAVMLANMEKVKNNKGIMQQVTDRMKRNTGPRPSEDGGGMDQNDRRYDQAYAYDAAPPAKQQPAYLQQKQHQDSDVHGYPQTRPAAQAGPHPSLYGPPPGSRYINPAPQMERVHAQQQAWDQQDHHDGY